jgi:hypothetical protein
MDETTAELIVEVGRLQRRTRRLERLLAASALAALAAAAIAAAPRAPEVLRARGLVLEDEQGRARLLLGAPVPAVDERLRKDPASGLVALDEAGHDRLQLGQVGGPQMGGVVQSRVSPATGLAVCDASGDERGGFGVMENGRVVLGLDAPAGEGVMLFVAPDLDSNGLIVNTHVGDQTVQRISLSAGGQEAALSVSDVGGKPRAALRVGADGARLESLDEEGRTLSDALGGGR